ncbi:MAG: hypothetical protein ACJ8AW_29600 [Rhodopila sp.]
MAAFCVILLMYGGGLAIVAAYLADMFGTQFVGAIHGRLLTAWSTAGLIGPVLVSYMREGAIAAGVPRSNVYVVALYLLAGLLVIGLIANALVRPVAQKWFMPEADVVAQDITLSPYRVGRAVAALSPTAVLAWLAVGLPTAWSDAGEGCSAVGVKHPIFARRAATPCALIRCTASATSGF